MASGTLSEIVLRVEKSDGAPWPVWISVPGSLITGKLVSHGEMIRRTSALVTRDAPIEEQAKIAIASVQVEETSQSKARQLKDALNAHLTDVTIFHGDKLIRSPFAVVELDSVGAWGVGHISNEE
jgi:hypothetical protein